MTHPVYAEWVERMRGRVDPLDYDLDGLRRLGACTASTLNRAREFTLWFVGEFGTSAGTVAPGHRAAAKASNYDRRRVSRYLRVAVFCGWLILEREGIHGVTTSVYTIPRVTEW